MPSPQVVQAGLDRRRLFGQNKKKKKKLVYNKKKTIFPLLVSPTNRQKKEFYFHQKHRAHFNACHTWSSIHKVGILMMVQVIWRVMEHFFSVVVRYWTWLQAPVICHNQRQVAWGEKSSGNCFCTVQLYDRSRWNAAIYCHLISLGNICWLQIFVYSKAAPGCVLNFC